MHTSFRLILLLVGLVILRPTWADEEPSWTDSVKERLSDTWNNGHHELYVPVYTHHLRFAYTQEKIDSYQENPYGIGYGRGKFINGNWNGLYAMGFQDSHYKPSYMAGYAWQTYWRPAEDFRVGAGYTVFLMTRADIGDYTPFPGILPVASVGYKNLALETAYVPGGQGNGNVLFFWGRYQFNDK
jgi:palmitoyl transferase